VDEREGFGEIDVEIECGGDGTRDLLDLDGVGQAIAEVVGVAAGEDLSLVFETTEGPGVDDAVAVALESVAVGVGRLGNTTPAGVLDVNGIAGQHGASLSGECRGALNSVTCYIVFFQLQERCVGEKTWRRHFVWRAQRRA